MSSRWDLDDPFCVSRQENGVLLIDVNGEAIPLVLRYDDIRQIARDWNTFSSDAPFRVPVPSEETMRRVRQLPIERDPPLHTEYRALVQPVFNRARTAEYAEAIRNVVSDLLQWMLRAKRFEFVGDIALPLQSRALTVLLRLPIEEADEWISWGTHVFHAGDAPADEKGAALDRYIERKIDQALASPGEDFFGYLVRCDFQGRKLTREELAGFANLAFAGGRDTVIKTLIFVAQFLATRPGDFDRLRRRPLLIRSAIEEFVRLASPLTHIGRVCAEEAKLHDTEIRPGHRVSLCWASANRDEAVFEHPGEIKIDRKPNPHLAFGTGPHACLGASHARVLLREFVSFLCAEVERLEILDSTPDIESWPGYRRQVGFKSLSMSVVPLP